MQDEKIKEVMQDESFVEEIFKMETPEEVQLAFKNKGIDISLDEIGTLGDTINAVSDKKSHNLCEEELNKIVGGLRAEEIINKANDLADKLKTTVNDMKNKSWSDYTSEQKAIAVTRGAIKTAGVGILALGVGAIGMVGYKTVKWAKNKYLIKE